MCYVVVGLSICCIAPSSSFDSIAALDLGSLWRYSCVTVLTWAALSYFCPSSHVMVEGGTLWGGWSYLKFSEVIWWSYLILQPDYKLGDIVPSWTRVNLCGCQNDRCTFLFIFWDDFQIWKTPAWMYFVILIPEIATAALLNFSFNVKMDDGRWYYEIKVLVSCWKAILFRHSYSSIQLVRDMIIHDKRL